MHARTLAAAFLAAALTIPARAGTLTGPGAPRDPSRRLVIVGQDLEAIDGYVRSARFPTPAGVTGYISLWGLLSSAEPAWGGLGLTPDDLVAPDVSWGAGPVNARNTSAGFPRSALVLGVYMTEQYCAGCLDQLAKGRFDPQIRRLAKFVKDQRKPVFLRIGYEFDGPWNIGYENTETYKAAWRRIADTLHALAPNAITVLQGASSPVGVDRDVEAWYPGDKYVDWIGFSWFLSGHPSQTLLADKILAMARSHGKPVLVAESSPQGYDLAGLTLKAINRVAGQTDPRLAANPATPIGSRTPEQIWSQWYAPLLSYVEANKDAIRAFAYINCNWDAQPKWGAAGGYAEGYWGDSRLQANADLAARWNAELARPAWMHGSASLFDSLVVSTGALPPDPDTSKPLDPARPTDPTRVARRDLLGTPGKTTLLIGQVYGSEYESYAGSMGLPAGSSHYGELYNGRINQGDDGDPVHPRALLEKVDRMQDSAIVQVAISWKDNPDLSRHPKDECGDFIGKRVYQVNQDIANGLYDDRIDSFASVFAAKPHITFLVRIEYEVSRFAFSWKPSASCPVPGKSTDFSDPSIIDDAPYKAAFRHVALRLRDTRKLSNVRFVFHPVRGIGDAKALFPGQDVVDFVALSLFNDDLCYGDHNCQGPFDGNVRQVFQWARVSLRKPRMVAECAWQPLATSDPSRRAWAASTAGLVDYLERLRGIVDSFDVSVVSYINSDWRAHGWDSTWWGDSRVETRTEPAAWWTSHVLGDPRFLMGHARRTSSLCRGTPTAGNVLAHRDGWTIEALQGMDWTVSDPRGIVVLRGTGSKVPAAALERGAYFLTGPFGTLRLLKP